ncbi:replication initiator [Micromonospora echinofusca]|uniref:replication initiator n=1 Tax=Micromonospora echinofusca TaxID=47858 RepID=UPI003F4D0D01
MLKEIAAEYGVCVRPLAMRRTDLDTGLTEVIDLPCGATREDKCGPCAKKNRRLRQAQIREGWHRDDEPLPGPQPATEEQKALILLRAHFEFARDEACRASQYDQVADLDEAIREVEEAIAAEGLRGRVGPCANWLLYGVQPKKAHAKLKPGRCKGKVHQRDTLGIGGRRILISRDWSGKTLADHKHDARAWVRALLGATTDSGATGQLVDDQGATAERVRHAWELARSDDPDVGPLSHRLMRSISERARWRSELLAAKDRAAQGSSDLSATQHSTQHHGEERQ